MRFLDFINHVGVEAVFFLRSSIHRASIVTFFVLSQRPVNILDFDFFCLGVLFLGRSKHSH